MVTEEALWGTAFANVVLEGVGELFLCLHSVYVANESGGAAEELTHGGAVIDGWGVREEVSVSRSSLRRGTFMAGLGDLNQVRRTLLMGMRAICVVA
jgi:hypothetical protein